MAFENSGVSQVIGEGDARVVDEDVQRVDRVSGDLNLRLVTPVARSGSGRASRQQGQLADGRPRFEFR